MRRITRCDHARQPSIAGRLRRSDCASSTLLELEFPSAQNEPRRQCQPQSPHKVTARRRGALTDRRSSVMVDVPRLDEMRTAQRLSPQLRRLPARVLRPRGGDQLGQGLAQFAEPFRRAWVWSTARHPNTDGAHESRGLRFALLQGHSFSRDTVRSRGRVQHPRSSVRAAFQPVRFRRWRPVSGDSNMRSTTLRT